MAVITYKCPNCGADLTYSPELGKYKCNYCDSTYTEDELEKIAEIATSEDQHIKTEEAASDTSQSENDSLSSETEAVIYTCPSCGAEIVTDATTAATTCFYCHNPVILKGRLEGKYLPNHIVPFEIGKDDAQQKFIKWISSKKFVPKDFSSKDQIENMAGVYFPYWVADEDVDVDAEATGLQVDIARIGDIETTRTSYYSILRKGKLHFEDLSKNALKKADHKLVEGVMPYHTKSMKEFSMGYLSGFLAEKRDLEQADVQDEMDQKMRHYASIVIKDTIPNEYTSVEFKHLYLQPVKAEWEYALMPVWTITYRRKNDDKIYYYAMNGQTGKTCGELPVSVPKLVALFAAVALPVLAICLAGGWLI